MSFLFITENKIVKPNTETLLIHPFKEIWERDNTEDKTFALEDFSYIEFTTSMKKSNPYSGYADEVRNDKVKKDIITRVDWEEDSLIKLGKEKIIEFQTNASPTYRYYMGAKIAAEKTNEFFTTFDMGDVNIKTGNPLYKPKDITSALNDTSRVLENLKALEEKVQQELFESTRKKGGKEISIFAM